MFRAMVIDVTDATFQTEVIERSATMPIVVDLWAPWCGPCTTLGPILERVVDSTEGAVALAKVNIDENPQIAGAFQVQSIPAVFAVYQGAVVDSFIGALPEHDVRQFVESLGPSEDELAFFAMLEAGDEASLRAALDVDPGNEAVIVKLAEVLVAQGQSAEALGLLTRVPETDAVRHAAAAARVSMKPTDDYDVKLASLLDQVKADAVARQEFVDLLELMGPDDPRTAGYRKQLTSRLF
jgi:putative thioredoxin